MQVRNNFTARLAFKLGDLGSAKILGALGAEKIATEAKGLAYFVARVGSNIGNGKKYIRKG